MFHMSCPVRCFGLSQRLLLWLAVKQTHSLSPLSRFSLFSRHAAPTQIMHQVQRMWCFLNFWLLKDFHLCLAVPAQCAQSSIRAQWRPLSFSPVIAISIFLFALKQKKKEKILYLKNIRAFRHISPHFLQASLKKRNKKVNNSPKMKITPWSHSFRVSSLPITSLLRQAKTQPFADVRNNTQTEEYTATNFAFGKLTS